MSSLINLFFLLCFPPLFCSARDTITVSNPLRDQKGETLVSVQQKYELGFFTPNGRSDNTRYLGIWYYKSRPRTVVWVANRDKPLKDSTGVFVFSNDGNLRVLDGQNKSYWSTPLTGRSFVNSFLFRRTARLMDTANLVLREEDPNNNVSVSTHWQSFDYPTDTFLPGMKMSEDLELYSWVSSDDPGKGDFTFQQDEGESQYKIRNKAVRYWQNKVSGSFIDSDDDEALLTILLSPQYHVWRLVMNFTGQIQIYIWDEVLLLWYLNWWAPRSPCSVYNVCGNFGSCNDGTQSLCKCLPGFEPKSLHKWNSRDFSDGCTRKSSERNKNDVFLSLKKMKVSKPDEHFRENSETECKMACLENENCQGYSYEFRETGRLNCWIWDEELKNLWENYTSGGREIQIRVAVSDIESTRRNCEVCGTNIIPYPLSTEPSCGDIKYLSFNCSNDTGQLSFQTYTGSYSVANIKPENRTFSILVQNCTDIESLNRLLQHNQSSLFYVGRGCNEIGPKFDGFLEDNDLKEVEISWRLPPEPICYTSKDCFDWPDSSCRASGNGSKKCQCNPSFHWEPSLLNCTAETGEYKKLKGHTTKEKPLFLILVGITATALVISGAAFSLYFLRQRRIARSRESRRRIQGNQAFRLYDSLKRVKDLISSVEFQEYDRKDIDVPLFNLESILAATNDFSDANMLGQGGFGPVYKGTFPGGQEIAIKRLSSGSGQGLQEFTNEVVLIAKLQHRNLVRLLGYCVEGGEKVLLYEYMPNKSLDSFLFDRTMCVLLNWEIRFTIIMGIARGMLYLHQDSRLKIIHRDMKTSNVLLDEEMSPKISDFGLARIFEGKQPETCTKRVVGSYGYMAPEYALDGYFSIKSDVFSFGVVVLEIVSGKRNAGFCQSGQTLSLLGYAWLLWNEDKASYLMDQTLSESCNQNEFLRCVNVGLLCVQEDPCDRPTMSDVLFMLGNETARVPNPRKPAFAVRRSLSGTASSSSKLESVNELTSSLDQGR